MGERLPCELHERLRELREEHGYTSSLNLLLERQRRILAYYMGVEFHNSYCGWRGKKRG